MAQNLIVGQIGFGVAAGGELHPFLIQPLAYRTGFGVADLSIGCQSQAASEVPEHGQGLHFRSGLRHLQNVIPLMKAHIDRDGNGHEALKRRHVLHMWSDVSRQHLAILLGLSVVPVHGGAHGNEVKIVAVIHHGIDALSSTRLDVRAIDGSSFLIGFHRRFIVAGSDVNMRRHVHQMARPWRHCGQLVRGRQRPLRGRRSLNCVDVIVDRTHVIGIAFDYRFERGHNFFGARLRSSILTPQAPGMQIHS